MHRLDVDRQHPAGLDRIHAEENLALAAKFSNGLKVVPISGRILDVRERDHFRARGDGGKKLVDVDAGVGGLRNHDVLHAEALGEVHPGVDVGGIFDGG